MLILQAGCTMNNVVFINTKSHLFPIIWCVQYLADSNFQMLVFKIEYLAY